MPLNEASGYRSNLTDKQQKEALAAIFGQAPADSPKKPKDPSMPPTGPAHFTDHEIERMRTILAHHDSTKKAAEVLDLNHPPPTNYRHQEFPKVVYNADKDGKPIHKAVADAEAHAAALADGWENEPFGEDDELEQPLDAASTAEAAEVDAKLAKLKADAAAKAKASRAARAARK